MGQKISSYKETNELLKNFWNTVTIIQLKKKIYINNLNEINSYDWLIYDHHSLPVISWYYMPHSDCDCFFP